MAEEGRFGRVVRENNIDCGIGTYWNTSGKISALFWLATNRELEDKPEFVEEIKSPEQIDEMLPRADFVVLSVPHTKETHHMFNTEKLQKMKPSAVLINIGRGGVVNENDLINALAQKTEALNHHRNLTLMVTVFNCVAINPHPLLL